MKSLRYILAFIILPLAFGTLSANAEENNPLPPPKRGEFREGRSERPIPGLTKEESDQVKAAMEKAKSDTAVAAAEKALQEARQAARDTEGDKTDKRKVVMDAQEKLQAAMKTAMIKADPTVEPLLKKVEENRKNDRDERGERGPRDRGPKPEKE